MPEELVILSPPISASGRCFYPVVRVSQVIHPSGGWLSVSPVAIFIEDAGSWHYVALEDGIEAAALVEEISRSDAGTQKPGF